MASRPIDRTPPNAGRTRMRLLKLREVGHMTALTPSGVYALMHNGGFPRPVRIGKHAVRWIEQEVLDFIASRPRGGSERPVK